MKLLFLAAFCGSLLAQVVATNAPVEKKTSQSEMLRYNVNWPSGLSLGEASLSSAQTASGWQFAFKVDASIPAFAVSESATAKASSDLCALELDKEGKRGQRQVAETTTFDQKSMTATRQTKKGGKSELTTPSCAKDALSYLAFLRKELAAGRIPQVQNVYYGAAYQVRAQYVGTQTLRNGDKPVECDKIALTIKSSGGEISLEAFFARDATRTPMMIQAPLAMGKFSMELAN